MTLQQAAAKFALNAINKFIGREHPASVEIVDLHIAAGKLSDALEAEQAQAVEPVAGLYQKDGMHRASFGPPDASDIANGWKSLYLHSTPPATGDHCEDVRNMVGERAELIARQRSVQEIGVTAEMRELAKATADMLEADASLADKRVAAIAADRDYWREQAQQVAVPMTESEIFDCDPLPHEMFDQQRIDFARAIERHHGIGAKLVTKPDSRPKTDWSAA